MLQKSMQWGLIFSLVGGLSSCVMDTEQRQSSSPQNPMVYEQATVKKNQAAAAVSKTSYASKEPTQKSVPGPKRAAAPQIPVIQ